MTPITPRGIEINADAAPPFEAIRVAHNLLRTSRTISLATLDPTGYPYSTVTNFICEPDGTVFFYTSGLTVHARNIELDNRVSVTVAEASNDVLTTPRLTLVGKALRVSDTEMEKLKSRYQATFPKAKLYLALRDTMLYRLDVEGVQLNGGPARNANDVLPEHLRVELNNAEDLMAHLAEIIERLNADDMPQKLAALANAGIDRWHVVSLDPMGIDLSSAKSVARYWFPEPIRSREDFNALVEAFR